MIRKFFELTDGIFLNYAWTDKHLEVTLVNAGSRKKDVFVGVDVFGRGCRGGGGFGTIEVWDHVFFNMNAFYFQELIQRLAASSCLNKLIFLIIMITSFSPMFGLHFHCLKIEILCCTFRLLKL